MTYRVHHLINGQFFSGGERVQNIINPATEEIIGEVPLANSSIINQSVQAAQTAFLTWSKITPLKRARILFSYKTLLEENIDDLAKCVTQEHGKTLSDARASITRGIDVVEFVCGIPHLLKGYYSENVAMGMDCYSLRQPLGVCAGITPFNFPAMIPLWMFPMAIACGNTFILKPSERDPSCSVRLVELLKKAGAPDGVVNVVQGDKEAVDALLMHPDVASISFVGSTPVAEYVYKTAIQQGKRAQTFGSAKNHCVVMPDANVAEVADAIVGAAYGSAGERCMAISVVIAVGDKVADELIKKMIPAIQNLKIGAGIESNIDMGPLISKAHWEKVTEYINEGVKEGAKLLVDGRKNLNPKKGFFLGGSLFDEVTFSMKFYREEIFGPVLCVIRVPDLQSAITLINEHEYGNGTAIFTNDGNTARIFSQEVKVGMVGINVPIPVPVAYHSFGGWKRSLFGDVHMHGMEGIQFYTKLKTITQRWSATDSGFVMPTH